MSKECLCCKKNVDNDDEEELIVNPFNCDDDGRWWVVEGVIHRRCLYPETDFGKRRV